MTASKGHHHSTIKNSSIFQWPIPTTTNDISIKEIIEKYYSTNNELLKHILSAKIEEDRKQAAEDILKIEQARIHSRYLDIELMKERSKLVGQQVPYTLVPFPSSSHDNMNVPVQQPATACITKNTLLSSPTPYSVWYPPLSRSYLLPITSFQQLTTPISPNNSTSDTLKKRNHTSISTSHEENKTLTHNRVIEALKAKIQRTSSSSTSRQTLQHLNKRQRTLPQPTIKTTCYNEQQPSSYPSPCSEKPILPPIDTSLSHIPATTTLSPITKSVLHSANDITNKL
ncbi:uncharacterized protein BX663DRAFT_498015 [Cokeromyces recurvatus]|uniref:uncharacterized protein n=1 Tax=Cokeromyces recurvatus TaxID=90255 RepID=UPI0022210FE1|nr:uncharacterized protein BX663DRAFT_498015 [Cokeromyces recurvatus]KAI7905887.1 hypothetical protein BX663DRAFT_498015 [Cokeromyces recurvatus]